MAVTSNDFRNGMTIDIEGTLYIVTYFQHVKPGKGQAFVRTRLKNVKTGAVQEKTFRAGEKVNQAILDKRKMQYLYDDAENSVFMDMETYEQLALGPEAVGDAAIWLKEGVTVDIPIHEGNPISVEAPLFVELEVAETVPGIKGDTASGGTKPATLETGAVIQVPLFISEGDLLKVDTRNGTYIERVKQIP